MSPGRPRPPPVGSDYEGAFGALLGIILYLAELSQARGKDNRNPPGGDDHDAPARSDSCYRIDSIGRAHEFPATSNPMPLI
jgi:hypothetical protein